MDSESRVMSKSRATALMDGILHVLEYALAALFIILFLATMLNIALRNLVGVAWLWIPDLTRFTFIWLVFLGIAIAYRRNDHLTIDFFSNRLSARTRNWALLVIHTSMLLFSVVLLHYGLEIAQARMRIPFDFWRQLPTGYAFLAVPASAALLMLFAVERIFTIVRDVKERQAL